MATWPKSPEERPTSDQIAVALLTAAREMGEEAQLRDAAERNVHLSNTVMRCRWPAIEALSQIYPRCRLHALGEVLGVSSNVVGRMAQAKRSAWWSDTVVNRAMALI